MATYKVLQDIEAEDKLLGPLTLRQFIYAIIVVVSGFLIFRLVLVKWWLALPLLPHTVFFALLAAPFGHDQSSEVWLLAKIRFAIKPRKRIWDQSGIKELVTITVPKRVERALTNGLTQNEVKSRLQALASTIDSRGWATKNVNVNLSDQNAAIMDVAVSDRLVTPMDMPQDVSQIDIHPSEDMFDEKNNPTAQNLDRLMLNAQNSRRQQLVQQMQGGPAPAQTRQGQQQAPVDYWFMSENSAQNVQPGYATIGSRVVAPGSESGSSVQETPGEEKLLEKIHEKKEKPNATYGHMRTILPLSEQPVAPPPQAPAPPPPPVTAPPDPAILELANNDDLNVATIARQANKRTKEPPQDEVVISLH